MASRSDKTLQWAKGSSRSPVLCGFATAGHLIIIDKLAMTSQAGDTVSYVGLKAGFFTHIVPHDIRRGFAQDTSYMEPVKRAGRAGAAVAAELGQSAHSLEVNITEDYVGRRTNDSWTRRVAANHKDAFGLEVTDNVYKKPKWSTNDFNRMYQAAGVDPKDRKATRNLKNAKYKEHENQWKMTRSEEISRPGKFPTCQSVALSF